MIHDMIKFTVDNFDERQPNKQTILKLIQQHRAISDRMQTLEAYYNGHHKIETRQRSHNAPNNRVTINWAKYITDTATGYFACRDFAGPVDMLIGAALGILLLSRMPQKLFENIIQVLVVLTAIKLFF